MSYHEEIDIINKIRLTRQLEKLPPYCTDFFRGIETKTESGTRIAYSYDLQRFFRYLMDINTEIKNINEITLKYLEKLSISIFEKYMQYLKYKVKNGLITVVNNNSGINRNISTLKSFYAYMEKTQRIHRNPTLSIDLPKIPNKEIVRLEPDEIAKLLDIVESGETLTVSQKKYHEKNKVRDLAILTILLGTGIRISECIGLDINDIDLKSCGMKVHRKGGNEVTVYFGDEVSEALENYLKYRKDIIPLPSFQDALFLSMRRSRISIGAVENLVKKYSQQVTPLKNITPHKLRSTYGTSLYRATGDIYLVADVLGHSDVNTTRKHYAAIEEDRRRSARNKVILRAFELTNSSNN